MHGAERQRTGAPLRRCSRPPQPPARRPREAAVEHGVGPRAAVSGSGHQLRDPGLGRRAAAAENLARVCMQFWFGDL